MKFVYLIGLDCFEIPELLGEPLEVGDGMHLTNNSKHISRFVSLAHAQLIGTLELSHLTSGKPVLFKSGFAMNEEAANLELINFMRGVNAYLHILWLQKDNSVNFSLGYALGQDNKHINSNTLSVFYSDSAGRHPTCVFNSDEIAETLGFAGTVFHGAREQLYPKLTILRKSTGRINMANFHLQSARSDNDLGIKISFYCSFFECLFSTATVELAHQLSERIAFFLSEQPLERIGTYKSIKNAYAVRSSVVHGSNISDKSLNDLAALSKHCDGLARNIYLKIFSSEELLGLFDGKDEKALNEYMLNMIFGVPNT